MANLEERETPYYIFDGVCCSEPSQRVFYLYAVTEELSRGLIENIPCEDVIIEEDWHIEEDEEEEDEDDGVCPDYLAAEFTVLETDLAQVESYLQSKGFESR
jgi:hypothetical protein